GPSGSNGPRRHQPCIAADAGDRSAAVLTRRDMHVALALTSLPLDFAAAVRQAAELGFAHADVVALEQRPLQDLDVLADSGLVVSCATLGRGLPPGYALDAAEV